MHEIKIIQTEDGSHSIYLPELNETYHSFHGAIQESIYVYIAMGFRHVIEITDRKEMNILEVGFGTGLNILLTIAEAKKSNIKTSIVTLEPFPLPEQILHNLNYEKFLTPINPSLNKNTYLKMIHNAPWNELIKLNELISLKKKQIRIQDFNPEGESFDLIFFDAFAPSKQPEIWQSEIFKKIFKLMNKGGVLVTYCAQGQFKRTLKAAGFEVETLKGPPGKKEMVRAKKPL